MTGYKNPTPEDELYRIVEEGLCIGCGICQGMAGSEALCLDKSPSGFLHPVVVGDLSQALVEKIYNVCPSTHLESLPQNLLTPETRHDRIWGPYLRIVKGWAKEHEERFEGSSGGILTALAVYLLKSAKVNFILHAKASAIEPTFGERHLCFSRADVLEAAGSRYGPAAPLIDIGKALTSHLALKDVYRVVMEKVGHLLRPQAWSLLTIDRWIFHEPSSCRL